MADTKKRKRQKDGYAFLSSFDFEWDTDSSGWLFLPSENQPWNQYSDQHPNLIRTPWLIQHHCNEWKWKTVEAFPGTFRVFHPLSTLNEYTLAQKHARIDSPIGLHMMRYWCDQIIIKTSASIWCHVWKDVRSREHDKKADAKATAWDLEFHKQFA